MVITLVLAYALALLAVVRFLQGASWADDEYEMETAVDGKGRS